MTLLGGQIEIYKRKPIFLLYVLLIISLPYFSLRKESLGLSLPLLMLLVITVVNFWRIVKNGSFKKALNIFDLIVLTYIIYAIVLYLFIQNDNFWLAILKTIVYYLTYISLKLMFVEAKTDEIEVTTFHGIVLGAILFIISIIYALYSSRMLSNILSDVSYWGMTFKIYGAMNSVFIGEVDYRSKDIMRSALGEVFAFYFIFLIVTFSRFKKLYKKNVLAAGALPLTLIFLVGAFSRRSIFGTIVSVVTYALSKNKSVILKVLSVAMLAFAFYLFIFVIAKESRIADLTDEARINQYVYVIDKIEEKPIFGYGYGAKIYEDKYVHNFLLASQYMLGVIGLVLGALAYLYIIYGYIKGMRPDSSTCHSFLLIIPIFGLAVGSTVEGVFTITSWVILALYNTLSQKKS